MALDIVLKFLILFLNNFGVLFLTVHMYLLVDTITHSKLIMIDVITIWKHLFVHSKQKHRWSSNKFTVFIVNLKSCPQMLILPVPITDEEKKVKILFSHFFVGASKGFMKAFKAFIKPFEAIKQKFNFYFNATFRNAREGKG